MSLDSLKQLILGITGFSILLIILSIARNPKTFLYSLYSLKSDIKTKTNIKNFLRLFLIYFVMALSLALSYVSLDVSGKAANDQSHYYLGNYNYAYREISSERNAQDVVNLQDQKSSYARVDRNDKVGLYANVSVLNDSQYTSNVVIFGFDNINLSDDEFDIFGENSENISINDYPLYRHKIDKDLLNGLDKFRGWDIAKKSNFLIVTNLATAEKITGYKYSNTIFTKNQLDISNSTLTKNLNDSQKANYISTMTENSLSSYQSLLMANISPFSPLLILSVLLFLLLLYPMFKTLQNLSYNEMNRFNFIQSTAAPAGSITKFLTYYFFPVFIAEIILASLLAYLMIFGLFNLFNLSLLFPNTTSVDFVFSPITFFYITANAFALFFLITFLIFYSAYLPKNKFKYSKISFIKLASGLVIVLMGITIIPFIKDIPEAQKGIIPYIYFGGPVTSLLGSLLFLRLNNKIRRLVIFTTVFLYLLSFIVLFFTHTLQNVPSGLLLLGLLGVVIIAVVYNEFSYKDFAKSIFYGIFTFLIIFLIVISNIGVSTEINNYNFDFSFQTYSVNDKSQNLDNLFVSDEIISKISFGKMIVYASLDNQESYVGTLNAVSSPKTGLEFTSLTKDEIDKFYNSNDFVILPPEFKDNQYVKENDSIKFKDIVSGQEFTKTIYKILTSNNNTDLSGKIIFPNLQNTLTTPKSSLNSIYLINTRDKSALKKNLAKYNIYDVIDVSKNLENSKNASKELIQSLGIFLIILDILILIFTLLRDKIKGILYSISVIGFSAGISLYYEHVSGGVKLSSLTLNLLIILILSVIIVYGTNIAYRKFKNRK